MATHKLELLLTIVTKVISCFVTVTSKHKFSLDSPRCNNGKLRCNNDNLVYSGTMRDGSRNRDIHL